MADPVELTTPADPFAPILKQNEPAASNPPPEIWKPCLPAPADPPAIEAIKYYNYGQAVNLWHYRDAQGRANFAVVRFEVPGAQEGSTKKLVLPYTHGWRQWTNKNGELKEYTGWHFKRPEAPVPLYGLDRLAARPNDTVLVVEGEKTSDGATRRFPKFVSVTSQGGCNAAERSDWSTLNGRDVYIWPDNDTAGTGYAQTVVKLAHAAGASSVRIACVPADWPDGWDLADDLPSGVTDKTLDDLLGAAVLVDASTFNRGAATESPTADAAALLAQDLDRLSRLPSSAYISERKGAAEHHGIGVVDLDRIVKVEKASRRRKAEIAARHRPMPVCGETQWPANVFAAMDGLYANSGEDAGPIWLCALIQVVGHVRDEAGESRGLLLRWHDNDGRQHEWVMPSRMLMVQPGELEGCLTERGLHVNVDAVARAILRRALNDVRSGSRVKLISQPGWHDVENGESAFVLLNGETLGSTAEALALKMQAEKASEKMRPAGSLADWQTNVAAKAAGNPIPCFAICAAFAGPLLEPSGESSGGFHYVGRSKIGKTLLMKAAASAWGLPSKRGLLRDWHSTANGMEAAAEECNDGLLSLDEIHQADPKHVVEAVYQLANEAGKQRLTKEAAPRNRRAWRVQIQSSGEVDIATMAAKAGQTMPAGAEVRVPSLNLEGIEVWPDLHGAASPVELMAELQASLLCSYGTAIRPFLTRLTAARDEGGNPIGTFVDVLRRKFANLCPTGSDAQVQDVARRFALVAAAGELATEWGVLPWEAGEATMSAEYVFTVWCNGRGGMGSIEESQHVAIVRAFLMESGLSRFMLLERDGANVKWIEAHPERPPLSRAGYRRHTDAGDEYLVSPDAWKDLCSRNSVNPKDVAKTLNAAGLLSTEGDGRNLTKPARVANLGKSRFYIVKPSIFNQEASPAANAIPAEGAMAAE